jgi:hypothetical protein
MGQNPSHAAVPLTGKGRKSTPIILVIVHYPGNVLAIRTTYFSCTFAFYRKLKKSMNFGSGAEPEQERTNNMARATLCSEPRAQASQPGLQQVQVRHLSLAYNKFR